jgi:hypothetical protein
VKVKKVVELRGFTVLAAFQKSFVKIQKMYKQIGRRGLKLKRE